MRRDRWTPRVIVAAGMSGVGVTSVCSVLQDSAPSLSVVDAGATWASIADACDAGCERFIIVTTHDIVAVSAAYALVKLVREHHPRVRIEVLVNGSDERAGLKTYERVQNAASHFLGEMVAYAGSIPANVIEDPDSATELTNSHDEFRGPFGAAAVAALHNLANRLDDELELTDGRDAWHRGERRVAS